jgi:hypothetical protein
MGEWMQTGYIFAVFRLFFCPKRLFGHSFAGDRLGPSWERAPARECPHDRGASIRPQGRPPTGEKWSVISP